MKGSFYANAHFKRKKESYFLLVLSVHFVLPETSSVGIYFMFLSTAERNAGNRRYRTEQGCAPRSRVLEQLGRWLQVPIPATRRGRQDLPVSELVTRTLELANWIYLVCQT